jgi:hypothetical protein
MAKKRFIDHTGVKSYIASRMMIIITWAALIVSSHEPFSFGRIWDSVIVPVWILFTVLWIGYLIISFLWRNTAGSVMDRS